MRRLLRTGLFASVLAVVFLLALLLYNPAFNQWLVSNLTDMVPELSIKKFDGLLLSNVRVQGLKYQNDQVDIRIQSAAYRLSLADLLLQKIQFEYLHASHVDIVLLKTNQPKKQESEADPFVMPVILQLDDFALQQLQIKQNKSIYLLDSIAFTLLYHGQHLQLSRFSLNSDMIQVQGDAELKLDSQLPFSVDLMLAKSIPDLADIKAHLALQGDSQKIDLNLEILAPNKVNAQGQILLNEHVTEFNLSSTWSLLQWPLQGERQYASENAQLTLQGTTQDYSLNLESEIFVKDLEPGQLNLLGQGSTEQFTIKSLSIKVLSGDIQGKGRISWADNIPSQLQLLANNLQLSSVLGGYSSKLSLEAELSGRLFDDPDFRVALKNVNGKVLDKTVNAKANIHYSAEQLLIEQLQASVGDNSLVAQGVIGDESALEFTMDVANIHELSADYNGAVFAEGALQGSVSRPILKFEILSDGLKFQQQQVGSLYAKGVLATAGEGKIDLTAKAGKLLVNGTKINKVELQSSGTFAQHHLSTLFDSEQGGAEIALQGGWNPNSKVWQGSIEQIKVQGTSAGIWQLIQAAPVKIELDQQAPMQLETNLCLAQISATGLVCFMAIADQQQLFSGTIKQFPLSALADWLPETLQIDSSLQAQFSLQNSSELTGDINISIDPGSIRLKHEQSGVQTISFKKAEFDVELLGNKLQSKLAILFNDVNEIEGQVEMTGLDTIKTAKIDGSLNIKLEDIGFLSAFIDSVNNVSGEVNAQLVLQGLLSAPKLNGSKMRLAQGKVNVPEMGLQVDDINIELNHAEDQTIALQAKAKIVDQSIKIDGQLEQYNGDQLNFQMTIKGDDLQLLQVPEMQAWVSPDLRLKGDRHGAKLEGEVAIPKAMLVFESLPAGAVALSDDEVIISTKKSEPKASSYPLDADIKILLGKYVSLQGFGLNTQLQGQLRAVQKKNQLKLYNELHSVKGTYKAFGQDLTIEKGQLLFNGDMENPGVNILASRKASDWEDKTIAYLRMSGTLKKPVITVYTEPALSESEALAYLLTGAPLGKSDSSNTALLAAAALSLGRDYVDALMGVIGIDEFDMKSTSLGQNSMVIGKRISSDLYARYIMDILTSQMQFAVIYMLTENISIETRAGTTHSSDIKYNIEFD